MSSFVSQVVLAMLRHITSIGAGSLTTEGLLDGDQAQALIGAVLTLAALGFSVWDKWKLKKKENDNGR